MIPFVTENRVMLYIMFPNVDIQVSASVRVSVATEAATVGSEVYFSNAY